MASEHHSLQQVLAVSSNHPFYNTEIQYPPSPEAIKSIPLSKTANLSNQPLLNKKNLYTTIQRLVNDTSPDNTYRQSVYVSFTGGGSGSKPLFFATDVHENRRQRASFGRLLRTTGLIKDGDFALTAHSVGNLYRSLDLTLEILENAGASVLAAGSITPPDQITPLLGLYAVNVLTGDSSQVVQVIHHISTLPAHEKSQIKIDKVIYTSEPLTSSQRTFIYTVLPKVKIYSLLGSAEAGAWALSNPDLTQSDVTTTQADFIFDTRSMLVEINPLDSADEDKEDACSTTSTARSPQVLPLGEKGLIVQTSLARLRNPLVRYNTGDVGSLHPLPPHAHALVPEEDRQHLMVLRLEGRDRRFSFDWYGNYIEFDGLKAIMDDEKMGALQWQVILDKMEGVPDSVVEIRLLFAETSDEASRETLVAKVRTYIAVVPENEHRFKVVFVKDLDEFERSETGRKVIKFIDRYNPA